METAATLSAVQVADLRAVVVGRGLPDDAAELIALIGELERLKSAACAVQADATVAFDGVRRSSEAAAGVPAARRGRGVANEVALARRTSPHRARSLVGLAAVLRHEMPHTAARLRDGSLDEWRAMLLARETACLSHEHRARIDEEVCGEADRLEGVGTRRLVQQVKRRAAALDPAAVAERGRRARSERCVTLRPAPDTMTYLTALLPVEQGVAVYAALTGEADARRAAGDERSRGQAMADLLVAHLTGQVLPETPEPPAVPVTVSVTVSAETLAGGHDPALLETEVLPAELARHLIGRASEATQAWFRRLFVQPATGELVALTSRRRVYADGLADLLRLRGQGICATPYCDAPIRHLDHITPVIEGGETTAANGQGLCEACNHAKQAPGWRQERTRHRVATITPTGHRYVLTA